MIQIDLAAADLGWALLVWIAVGALVASLLAALLHLL